MKTQNLKLVGKNIYLRELDESDATEEYRQWLRDPAVNEYLVVRDTTLGELKDYIKQKREDVLCLFFGIFDKDNDRHIGNIKLELHAWGDNGATFGMVIGNKEYWNKGLGKEIVSLVVDHAFNVLGLDYVDGGVLAGNDAAIKCYMGVGFRMATEAEKEGRKDIDFAKGEMMVILKDKS